MSAFAWVCWQHRERPRRLIPVVVVLFACLVTDSALAEGGKSIASAPPVVFGQQQFGNTATGELNGQYFGLGCRYSWWTLSVLSGDAVTIDWETENIGVHLRLYPIGTTDYTFNSTEPADNQTIAPNGKSQDGFTASRTGTMPLALTTAFGAGDCGGDGGPYDFTAYVKHTVRLSIPRYLILHRQGTLPVLVHNPEGGIVNDAGLQVAVQIRSGNTWLTVGTASVTNSVAVVHLNVPPRLRGHKVSLRALAHGSDYLSATTPSLRVRVRVR